MKGIPQGRYTKEFREEAVKMVEEGSNSGHYGVYRDFLQEAAPIGKVGISIPCSIRTEILCRTTGSMKYLVSTIDIRAHLRGYLETRKEDCATGAEIHVHHFSSVFMQTLFIKLRAESSLMSAFKE